MVSRHSGEINGEIGDTMEYLMLAALLCIAACGFILGFATSEILNSMESIDEQTHNQPTE